MSTKTRRQWRLTYLTGLLFGLNVGAILAIALGHPARWWVILVLLADAAGDLAVIRRLR
jgi:hypothetical protein